MMNSVYESIMAGLNEAIADALGETEPLERNMITIPASADLPESVSSAVHVPA